VLYIFGLPQVYETYLRVFRENVSHFNKEKFLFIILPDLYRRFFNVFENEVTHGDKKTTLGNIFNMSRPDKESGWNEIEGE